MVKKKVRNIFRTETSTNFKLSTQMDNEGLYQLQRMTIKLQSKSELRLKI